MTTGHLHTCGDEGSVFVIKSILRLLFVAASSLPLNRQSPTAACLIAMTDGDVGGELIWEAGAIPPSLGLYFDIFSLTLVISG